MSERLASERRTEEVTERRTVARVVYEHIERLDRELREELALAIWNAKATDTGRSVLR